MKHRYRQRFHSLSVIGGQFSNYKLTKSLWKLSSGRHVQVINFGESSGRGGWVSESWALSFLIKARALECLDIDVRVEMSSQTKRFIYFCGSIRGGRDDAPIYKRIIDQLKVYGEVLTEHIADPNIMEKEKGGS